MSIRDEIIAATKKQRPVGKVQQWVETLPNADEFREVAASGEFSISALQGWAKSNGYTGGESILRKWVKDCQSEIS